MSVKSRVKLEVERRFLVQALPAELEKYQSFEIRQGYYSDDSHPGFLRLRQYGEDLVRTKKFGSGLTREEHEENISVAEFENLWPLTEGRQLRKKRYLIPHHLLTFELDLYYDQLEGLQIVEVEFESVSASRLFKPPGWFGSEVTERMGFSNSAFAWHGIPEAYQELLRTIT